MTTGCGTVGLSGGHRARVSGLALLVEEGTTATLRLGWWGWWRWFFVGGEERHIDDLMG